MITPDSLRAWNAGLIAVAAPTPPEVDALKEELNSWRNTAAERTMQKASLLDELVTLKAENERLRKDAERLDFIENSRLEISDYEEGFVINRITGYPNDREWHQVGEGETIREAIDAAMTAPDTKGE